MVKNLEGLKVFKARANAGRSFNKRVVEKILGIWWERKIRRHEQNYQCWRNFFTESSWMKSNRRKFQENWE